MRKSHFVRRGFTLIEMLIVISIMLVLMGMVLGVISSSINNANQSAAKVQLNTIAMGVTQYIRDWDELPPLNPPAGFDALGVTPHAASELLVYYLCNRHTLGESSVGAYFPATPNNSIQTAPERLALVSPLKGFYSIGFIGNKEFKRRSQCIIVDPGKDKLLGGTVDNENGFIPDNSDANGDGKADHLDNLTELVSLR